MLQQQLSAILPEAALWFKGDERPQNEVVWVISPFEFDIMGYALVSVALQKGDELLMGILGNLSNFEMIAAELGGGTWMEDKEFAVAANEMSEGSSNMQFITKNRNTLSKYASLISTMRKRYNFKTLTNNVDENISYYMTLVARGELDFTMGMDFNYHNIAAAICIVEQAGGLVTDFKGGKTKLYTGEEFFCSNRIIHQQFMDVAKNSLKQ